VSDPAKGLAGQDGDAGLIEQGVREIEGSADVVDLRGSHPGSPLHRERHAARPLVRRPPPQRAPAGEAPSRSRRRSRSAHTPSRSRPARGPPARPPMRCCRGGTSRTTGTLQPPWQLVGGRPSIRSASPVIARATATPLSTMQRSRRIGTIAGDDPARHELLVRLIGDDPQALIGPVTDAPKFLVAVDGARRAGSLVWRRRVSSVTGEEETRCRRHFGVIARGRVRPKLRRHYGRHTENVGLPAPAAKAPRHCWRGLHCS
jgi:hypothetical protein